MKNKTQTAVVLTERRGSVLLVTLNRPQAKNALTPKVILKLGSAFKELSDNPELRAAVLTGADGFFCSGMDLKEFSRGFSQGFQLPSSPLADLKGLAAFARFLRWQQSPKPVIAAVEGGALAGGFEFMYQCDLVVAARDAQLGLPEVKRGLIAFGGVLTTLPHRLPLHLANELALLGEPISAQRGYEIGLLNRVCEPGTALETALDLAQGIAENSPRAVGATRNLMLQSKDWTSRSAYARQLAKCLPVLASRDAREGAKAFAQKRKPVWA